MEICRHTDELGKEKVGVVVVVCGGGVGERGRGCGVCVCGGVVGGEGGCGGGK